MQPCPRDCFPHPVARGRSCPIPGPPHEGVHSLPEGSFDPGDPFPGHKMHLADDKEADPDDDKFIESALNAKASFVASGDRHLLDIGSYEGIRIVTPTEFLQDREAAS